LGEQGRQQQLGCQKRRKSTKIKEIPLILTVFCVQLILYADLDPHPLNQTVADAASATFETLFIQQLAYLHKLFLPL
jgi:hypothetical protein